MFLFIFISILCLPLVGILALLFVDENAWYEIRCISNWTAMLAFIAIVIFALFHFVHSTFVWSHVIFMTGTGLQAFTLSYDTLTIGMLLLSAFLNCCCFAVLWPSFLYGSGKLFSMCFLLQATFLNFVFVILDVLYFYVFFESVLITMFIIIGRFGTRERKIRASYMLFLYTLGGSVLMLLAVLFIYVYVGSTDYFALLAINLNHRLQKIFWLIFFLAFAVKVPMVPFHIWLPEAHVEAPTVGSVVLAGVLLKMGTYGFMRFAIPLFPYASVYFAPFVCTLSLLSIVLASFSAIRQTDIKRIIAYSSIAHMNLIMIGLFSFDFISLTGSYMQMISHGLVSGGLFLLVGVLYDRYHTRMITYYGGLVQGMPWFTTFFLIFTLANIALPGTSSFVGEFLIFLGSFEHNAIMIILAATGMVLGGIYSLWLFNRICFGNVKIKYIHSFTDMSKREVVIFFVLLIIILGIGICPSSVVGFIDFDLGKIISFLFFSRF